MPQPRPVAIPENRPAPVIADRQLSPSAAARPKAKQASLDLRDNYQLPPIDLLRAAPAPGNTTIDKAALERNARLLESVLDDFNVKGSIVEEIGRAHVCTPVTNAHLVCRLLLEKK